MGDARARADGSCRTIAHRSAFGPVEGGVSRAGPGAARRGDCRRRPTLWGGRRQERRDRWPGPERGRERDRPDGAFRADGGARCGAPAGHAQSVRLRHVFVGDAVSDVPGRALLGGRSPRVHGDDAGARPRAKARPAEACHDLGLATTVSRGLAGAGLPLVGAGGSRVRQLRGLHGWLHRDPGAARDGAPVRRGHSRNQVGTGRLPRYPDGHPAARRPPGGPVGPQADDRCWCRPAHARCGAVRPGPYPAGACRLPGPAGARRRLGAGQCHGRDHRDLSAGGTAPGHGRQRLGPGNGSGHRAAPRGLPDRPAGLALHLPGHSGHWRARLAAGPGGAPQPTHHRAQRADGLVGWGAVDPGRRGSLSVDRAACPGSTARSAWRSCWAA